MIRARSASVSAEQSSRRARTSVRTKRSEKGVMTGRGAEVRSSGDKVTRSIGGVEREGVSMDLTLAGENIQIEIYAFARDHDIVALVLQHELSEGVLATRYFNIIAASLR